MMYRRSTVYIIIVLAATLVMGLSLGVHPILVDDSRQSSQTQRQNLVRDLELTDLALFTEAPYTRHPSQADLFVPFKEHPLALDQFPSGSLILPPRHLRIERPVNEVD